MSGAVTYTSREEIDVHRFSWGISVGIPLLAIFLQIFLRELHDADKWLHENFPFYSQSNKSRFSADKQ